MSENFYLPRANDFIARIEIAKLGMSQWADIPAVPDAGEIIEVDGNRMQVMFNGVRVPADAYYGDWTTDLIRECQGHHEPQEEYVFHEVLKHAPKGASMIELGSYWAYYTTWFLTHVEGGRAVIVEPDPVNLPVALVTLAANNCIAPIELGVVGERVPDFENVHIGGTNTFNVPVLHVDDLMRRHQLDHLYILHSDIQGGEVKMFDGAREAFSNNRIDYVFISTHGDESHEFCQQKLHAYGYRVLAAHTMEESYSYDGLVVACSSAVNDFDTIEIKKRTPEEWTQDQSTLEKSNARYKPALSMIEQALVDKEAVIQAQKQKIEHLESEYVTTQQRIKLVEADIKKYQLKIDELSEQIEDKEALLLALREDQAVRMHRVNELSDYIESLEDHIKAIRQRKIVKVMKRLGRPIA